MTTLEPMIAEENKPESEPIALFDLDGTLADFDKEMSAAMASLASEDEEQWNADRYDEDSEPPYILARRQLIKKLDGFWSGLPPMRDGFEVMRIAQSLKYDIMVCSRGPRNNPKAWGEKLEWCRRYLPVEAKVTLTEDKGLVYGKVLVDDWPPYIKRWLTWRPRGLVIMPARRWNAQFAHPQVIRYEFGGNDGVVWRALSERISPAASEPANTTNKNS